MLIQQLAPCSWDTHTMSVLSLHPIALALPEEQFTFLTAAHECSLDTMPCVGCCWEVLAQLWGSLQSPKSGHRSKVTKVHTYNIWSHTQHWNWEKGRRNMNTNPPEQSLRILRLCFPRCGQTSLYDGKQRIIVFSLFVSNWPFLLV